MEDQIARFLQMNNPLDLIQVFFVMALLPALGEESLFRGALQPVLRRKLSGHAAVWITAALFALMHQQFYTFLPILALGAVLGYLREWSGSIWLSVIMHLVNNGSIVIGVYFSGMTYAEINDLSSGWEWYWSVPAIIVFMITLFVTRRSLTGG